MLPGPAPRPLELTAPLLVEAEDAPRDVPDLVPPVPTLLRPLPRLEPPALLRPRPLFLPPLLRDFFLADSTTRDLASS